jgi:uncharacterized repeat protein (TIGR03803 family)/YD repeat-containing protein
MPLSFKRRLTLAASVSLLFFLGGELPSSAQQAASFTYDQRGRLTVFVAPDGTITRYVYDAAGNITSIQRGTAADLMRIDSVTPNTGVVPGNALTIVGQNFDPVASNNTVLFTGVSGSAPALVTGASATQLTVQVPQGAVTGTIRVQRLGQTASGPVVTLQTLAIASISPTSPVVFGSTITLTGQGFSLNANGNTVSFLGAGGASIPVTVTTADPTQLSLQVPAGAVSGLISVTSGAQTVQGPNTQIQTLLVTGVTPAGPYLPGATITLAGQGFSLLPSGNIVTFTGANGTTISVPVTSSNPASLTLQIPQEAVTGTLSISVAPQTVTGPNIQLQTLQITSISPTTPVVSGTRITINGLFFSPEIGGNAVRFAGVNGTTISVNPITATSTQLLVDVPAGVVTGNVAVTVGGQTAQGSVLQIQALQVTGVTPAGPYVAGSTITLSGQGFSLLPGGNIVTFAGANGTTIPVSVTTTNSAALTLQIPQGVVTGIPSVSVAPQTVTGPNIQIQTLQVTGITSTGPYVVGSTITLSGQGFSLLPGGNIVNFAGANGTTIPVPVATSNSAALTFQVPQGAVTGTINVTVAPQTANGLLLNIYSFTPTSASFGSSITITGGGFVNPSVTFNGSPATITASNSSSITVSVPLTATTGSLVLTNNGLSNSLGNFTMLTTVTGFTPSTGLPGSSITISGSGFTPLQQLILFNSLNVLMITARSSTEIIATIPTQIAGYTYPFTPIPISSGSYPLYIYTPSIYQAVGNFTVFLPLSVTGFLPSSGNTGSSVTITGENLLSASVSFNGVQASITNNTATSITAVVPADAATGSLKVSTNGQQLAVGTFEVVPTFSGFTPSVGVIGLEVTISGTGLQQLAVSFNGIPATVLSNTATSLRVRVPDGATSGPLRATTSNNRVYELGTITVTAIPAAAPQKFTLPVSTPGQQVTITGANLNAATAADTVVKVNGVTAQIVSLTATNLTFTVPNIAITGYASDSPGIAATVTIETIGGLATVPKTLYLVPNISFEAPINVGMPVVGNLNNLGDNGLIKVPGLDLAGRLLGINATHVSGSGRLQVFIFTPDGDFIQRVQLPKDADFTLTDGLLQRIGRLTLPGEGNYIFQVAFDQNPGQATGEIHAGLAASSTLTTLHTFTGPDGAYPNTRLTLGTDGVFYGATYSGGQPQRGSYYRISPTGDFSFLHELSGNEGEIPNTLLAASDGFLYGTTQVGGANGKGTLLRLATDGTLQVIHAFAGGNSDGEQPLSDLVQSADGSIYGTTFLGGSNVSEGKTYTTNSGVAFRFTSSGSYSIASNFGGLFFTSTDVGTTKEQPLGRLVLSSNGILSGTSQQDCSGTPCGNFFQRSLVGTTNIPNIPLPLTASGEYLTTSTGVVQGRDGAFYGVIDTDLNTYGGIFRVRPGDSRATIIKSFDNAFGSGAGELNLGPDGNFYGVVYYGGETGNGQIYRMEPDGTTVGLYSFTGEADGRYPSNGIVWGPDGNLYGVANSIDDGTYGNVFRLTIHSFPIVNTASTNQGSPGSAVVLTGVNLEQTLAVKFNGTPAQFTVISPTQITAIVPSGATSGLISVTNLFGSATAPTRFTVP